MARAGLGGGMGRLGARGRIAAGAPAAVGGAALLVGETDGFATDFTYATDAQRVAKKVAGVTTEYGLSFFTQAGTSSKWVYNAAGTLVNVAAGSLALDYDPVTHAAKGLLCEPQATNLVAGSNTFTSGWDAPYGLTMAQNATGPLGANTATTLTMLAGTGLKTLFFNGPATGTYRYSIYAKAGTLNWISLGDGNQTNAHGASFNLSAGTVGTVIGRFSAGAIQAVGNSWYRCSATVTGSSAFVGVAPQSADSQGNNWNATGGETVLISACQAETGTVATSYIPTTSASATRAADVVTCLTSTFPWSAAGANSIVSNAAGIEPATAFYWNLHDGTDNERYLLDTSSGTKKARLFTADGNVTQTDMFGASTPVAGTYYKVAVALATNDFAGSIDGGTVATDAVGTLPTVTTLLLGGNRSSTGKNVYLKSIKIVPRRMTNGQLQTETAP